MLRREARPARLVSCGLPRMAMSCPTACRLLRPCEVGTAGTWRGAGGKADRQFLDALCVGGCSIPILLVLVVLAALTYQGLLLQQARKYKANVYEPRSVE